MSLLSPIGWIYGKVTAVRNSLYNTNTFASYPLGAPTLSIGNITAGGTGKTPLVRLVAEILADRGEKVCILTRGYGRQKETDRVLVSDRNKVLANVDAAGDEPVELANRLLGKAIVVADADRVAAASWAREKFGITVFVLDDAFQHRRAKRDLDIVCICATDPFGGEIQLPGGRLREPIEGLERADAIVITRSELASDIASIEGRIRELNPDAKLFHSFTRLQGLVPLNGPQTIEWDFSESAFAFAGIGNPAAFHSLLRNQNINLAGSHAFRDHYKYSQHDVDELEGEARSAGASVLMTTAKDAVKLSTFHFKLPCLIAMIDVEIDKEEEFVQMVISSFL
jgi:tetraacyldisaccharide 4'-kinase